MKLSKDFRVGGLAVWVHPHVDPDYVMLILFEADDGARRVCLHFNGSVSLDRSFGWKVFKRHHSQPCSTWLAFDVSSYPNDSSFKV